MFGCDLYTVLSQSKIVVNGSIDTVEERGNMRCFEATGCGCLLLSGEGIYPEGFNSGQTFVAYNSAADAVSKINELLRNPGMIRTVSVAGHTMIKAQYSKQQQWTAFQNLLS